MGVRKYRGQIVCDKRWPDGSRTTRVCGNKTQAKQLLDRINASIADGSWLEFKQKLQLRDRGAITLQEYSETYIEQYAKVRNKPRAWQRKLTSLKPLKQFMGKIELEAITPVRLHNYVSWRKKSGVSDATINRDLTILKHMLNYATECGVIEGNPVANFKNLKEERKERQRFTEEEIQRVINKVKPECRPLFTFILETGCRREEALSVTHPQVQADARLVVFTNNTKSRKYRYVPLTEKALEAIHALPKLDTCSYIFYNPKTNDRWKQCRKAWEKARESMGLPELQVKDLRRHYAINLAENGADMHDIQQVLGHSSVTTTERHYAQFSPRHSARKILRVLEGGKSTGNKTETSAHSQVLERSGPVEVLYGNS